jgi:division protein CdvB (Snf7/Vps24/ESCRT-III family)
MPTKWSALQVSQAMDEVENQINLAGAFLDEAKAKAREARNIVKLPNYLDERLVRLVIQIERLEYVKSAIDSVRKAIPEGAIEAEVKRQKQGIQQSLGF